MRFAELQRSARWIALPADELRWIMVVTAATQSRQTNCRRAGSESSRASAGSANDPRPNLLRERPHQGTCLLKVRSDQLRHHVVHAHVTVVA